MKNILSIAILIAVLSIFISTEINTKVYKTQYQQDLCYKIKKSDYSFLSHDSYIDLNEPRERLKNNIEWLLNKRPSAKKGRLKKDDFEMCRMLIHKARVLKGKECKQYGFFD